MKTGILIVNIGTPESPSTQDVRIYLKKFLMDEDVISLPFLARWILVNLIIVPFRAVRSAAKYAKIWTPEGSPLKVNTEKFFQELQNHLSPDYSVKIGMSFSEPSILTALTEFKQEQVDQIIVCPMFPQYADATTGSVIKAVRKISTFLKITSEIKYIKPFYNQDFYLDNVLLKMKKHKPQHWIFSYHGLPEKQITKNSECQLSNACCLSQKTCTVKCYRSHCAQTTQQIAQRLNLAKSDYTMTFQSRLGVKKWLQPYTDDVLKALPQTGIKNIAVVSPAFVADCLETLEEINLESRETFKEHGGEQFDYVDCLNAEPIWVKGFSDYVKNSQNLERL
jgi:protoporphyrin/coproporphyrin ferrochelatase